MAECTDAERKFLDDLDNGKPFAEARKELKLAGLDPGIEQELVAATAELRTAQARFDAAWNDLDAAGIQGADAAAFLEGKAPKP